MHPISKLTLYVTRRCNLHCAYCFVDREAADLPWAIGRRSLDWLVHEVSGERRDLFVGFFGGEPLVAWETVRRLMEHGTAEASRAGKRLAFYMTTNGLMLDRAKLAFLRRYPMTLVVSVDGDEQTHDRFRRTAGGGGCFRQLRARIPAVLAALPATRARITVNPATAAVLARSVEAVLGLGFRRLTIGFNTDAPWSSRQLHAADRELRKVAEVFLERMMTGDPVWINCFDMSLRHLVTGVRPQAVCGAGRGLVSLGLGGEIYPCHRFAAYDGFRGGWRLGDLDRGIDERRRRPFLRYRADKSLGCATACRACSARAICGGGCLAKAYAKTGLLQMSDPLEQKLMVILGEIAAETYSVLCQHRPPAFERWRRRLRATEACDA